MIKTLKKSTGIVGIALTAILALSACGDIDTNESSPSVNESSVSASSTTAPATPSTSTDEGSSTAPSETNSGGSDAAAALADLQVSDDTMSGYERSAFKHWTDIDGNGCDARDDTLIKFMPEGQTNGCEIVAGSFQDPYTGATNTFDPDAVGGGIDIDHVVALSAGWKTGMGNASDTVREQFANDPLNLVPTDAGVNRYKSDKDASEWIPSDGNDGTLAGSVEQDCNYVARQVAVKAKYSLWVTSAEKNSIGSVLAECPEQKLPVDGSPVVMDTVDSNDDTGSKSEAPVAEAKPTVAPQPKNGVDPDMGSCAEATAAGYGPYVKGEHEEYGFYRDGDGDGTVCE